MKPHQTWRKSVPDFCAMDVATANENDNSTCAIGIARVVRGRVVATARWQVRPPFRRFRYKSLHGIRWRDVKTAPTLPELWPLIVPWFRGATFMAAHGAEFHKRTLLASLEPIDGPAADLPPYLCTMRLMGFVWDTHNQGRRAAARQLRIPLRVNDPESDACASAEILLRAWREWYLQIDCIRDLLTCCMPQCGE
jgi:DNA polymerase III subunit epsilon